MKKRLLSLLLVMMMLITAMPLAAAQSTNNYKVDWLVQNNIVQGRGDGELSLGKNITRAEFTKMVLAVTGELNQANLYAAASAFKDVNNHWAKNIISYATQRGYLAGYQDGSFRPDAPIKLDECIAILARLNPDFAEPKVKTGYWAQAYIDYAKTSGILNGIANTNNLKTFATRETAFNMAYNEVQVYTFVNKKIAEEARRLLEEAAAKKEEEAREEEARQAEARKARERKERRERQERREREERLDRYYRTEYNVYFNLGSGYEFKDRLLANTFYKLPQAPAAAPAGQKFKVWNVNGAYYNEGAYALVDGDLYISPVWEVITTPPTPAPTEHKVEVLNGVTDHAEAAKGTRVTVTATVEPGKKFVKWVTIGLNLTEAQKKENPFTFTMPANDVKFTAVIEDDASAGKTYKVTAKEAKTSEINAAEGQEVKVTAETKPNMEFDKWETTDLNLSEAQKKKTPLTFKMPAHAVTITATYKPASQPQKPPAPTGLEGVAPTAAGNDGKITGVNSNMEYATDANFTKSIAITGEEITGLAPGTYYVRVKANGNTPAGDAAPVTVPAITPEPTTKSIKIVSTTHKTVYKVGEELDTNGLTIEVTKTNNATERVNVIANWVNGFDSGQVNPSLKLTITYEGKTTTYTIKVIKKDGPEAPQNLVGVAATAGDNGKITGVNESMEYATDANFTSPKAINGTEITGLAPGTYYVRVKATETTEAGAYAEVTVGRAQEAEYELTVQSPINCTVTVKVNGEVKSLEDNGYKIRANANNDITVEWTANNGYELAYAEVYYLEGEYKIVIETERRGNTLSFKMPKKNIFAGVAYSKIDSQVKEDVYNKLKALEANNEPNFNVTKKITGEHTGSEGTSEIVAEVTAGISKYLRERKSNYIEAISSKFGYDIEVQQTQQNNVPISSTYTVKIEIKYLHTKEQEAAINTFVDTYISGNLTDDKIKAKPNKQDLTAEQLTYEKIKAVHDYIITNAAYIKKEGGVVPEQTESGTSTHSPYAIVSERVGVCQAYAGLFQKFMNKLKIVCYYVTGNAGGPHAWNLVKIGDKYYNIDLTFDDPVVGDEQDGPVSGKENYKYFLKSDTSISNTHTRDENVAHKADENYQGAATGLLKDQQN